MHLLQLYIVMALAQPPDGKGKDPQSLIRLVQKSALSETKLKQSVTCTQSRSAVNSFKAVN